MLRHKSDLGDHVSCISEVATPTGVGLCKEVFDQSHPNVVTHFVELLVDLGVVVVVVGTQLGHNSSIRERNKLSVDLFHSRPGKVRVCTAR